LATVSPSVVASADVGSNSVHLLVAVVAGHRLTPLIDESVFLGLGSRVTEQGYLGSAARAELAATLVRYADTARRLGASTVTFLGTQPVRSAADAGAIVHEAVAASGAPLHVLTHEEEALLTLIGVTEGRPVTSETLVIDIGGGSSEFCLLAPVGPPFAAGLQLGSASLTDAHVAHDPATAAEVSAMRAAAGVAIRDAPEARPAEIVAVGGTVSNLVKVLPAAMLDRTLTRERIAEAQSILASEPAEVAAERHLINPIRARILPAGGTIVDAILERYGVDRLRVSEAGIREGAVLAVAHAGSAWRDRLSQLAHGWRTDAADERRSLVP
jgi:exopolyphosphatase / guanosine-5'-triphosphate,3'-diphosphate pyrophosphatase